MPLIQLVHITAAYSNAVLVAILPHVSDYSEKLGLPISLPITESQVKEFRINPFENRIGSGVWLTNHYQFAFNNGYVGHFQNLVDNPFMCDDPAKEWPKFAGKDNMTTNDAIQMARDAVVKLGYDLKTLEMDALPFSVQGDCDLKAGYHLPYCDIRWNTENNGADFQINMNQKTIVGMSLISKQLFQTNPVVSVTPELEQDYQNRVRAKTHMLPMTINTNVPLVLPH